MAGFPDADPAAIGDLAAGLRALSASAAEVGAGTEGLCGSVMGSQRWQGSTSEQWRAVITERIGDAGLTSDVLGSAAAMLSGLAGELEAEQRVFDRLSGELFSSAQPVLGGPEPYAVPAPDPAVQREMDACAARAAGLLEDAARKLLTYAMLAGDIRAVPAADRTPGVPDGADRRAASLGLLAILFGSVVGNRTAGSKFEQAVLRELGITKNTSVWRPDPPFEGKLTATGLARGTIVDGRGSNFLLEIKGAKKLEYRFQIRLQRFMARLTNSQLWIIKAGSGNVGPRVVQATEDRDGGVLYTSDNGKTYTDGYGNPVQVTYDKTSDTLRVSGYQPSTRVDSGSTIDPMPSPDQNAPASSVSPDVAEAPPSAAMPDFPEDPEIPDPEIFP